MGIIKLAWQCPARPSCKWLTTTLSLWWLHPASWPATASPVLWRPRTCSFTSVSGGGGGGGKVTDLLCVWVERSWNMWIPGFGVEERAGQRAPTTEAHKQVGGSRWTVLLPL